MANKPFAVQGMNVVTPKGAALWCKHKEPDRKFDADGTLSTSLVLKADDPATTAFIERLDKLLDKAFEETVETLGAKGKQVRKRDMYVEDEDGNYVFKFNLKGVDARKARGQQHSIQIVDAHKNKLTDAPLVGNGSEIRVASFVFPYYMAVSKEVGLSFMWTKMQIIELVEFASKDDDFDDEDGYVTDSVDESFGDDDF